jgi:hypothetical protein
VTPSLGGSTLVAIRSFLWRDPDEGLLELSAGLDRVAATHRMLQDPWVRARFAEVDSEAGRAAIAAARTRKPAPPRRSPAPSSLVATARRALPPRSSEPIELRDRLGDHTVVIGSFARRLINNECFAYRYAIEEQEIEATGGGLFGEPIWSWDRESYVASANFALSNGWRHSAELDIGAILAKAGSLKKAGSTHVEIGTWHPHPGTDDGRPSPGDLQAWLGGLNWLKSGSRYVSLIATRGTRGWASPPRLHAWVMYRDRFGDAICERAAVREGSSARVAA